MAMSKMIFHTCFNNQSQHGYKANALKSGICKYMRRGEAEKMKWCVMELAMFRDHPNPKANGLITNLVNRLKILLMEEITPSEIGIISQGISLLDEYEADRDKRHLLLEFCDLVSLAKRSRTASYMGSWWRHKSCDMILEKTVCDKCEKYRKKGDSEGLMILGENLIEYMETRDERMFGVFTEMYCMEGKMGNRYRRKDGVLLWFEIMSDYIADEKVRKVYDFALKMFFRRGMTERPAFGVWMGVIIWRDSMLSLANVETRKYESADVERYYSEMETLTLDSYVVNDYHVNKSMGLGHFAKNGGYVKDEDLSLMDDPKAYKDFYVEMKVKADADKKKKPRKKSVKKDKVVEKKEVNKDKVVEKKEVVKEVVEKKPAKKRVKVEVNMGGMKRIQWADVSDVHVIEEGVCGGKVPCIVVTYGGKRHVLKMFGKSMNYGADYITVDKAKSLFGLRDMNMERVVCDKEIVRKDKAIKTFVKNWDFVEKDAVYCMMEYWDNVGDLGKNKGYLKDESVVRECMKIRLVDGLFRSSDNIMRNVLVNTEGELLSIDEGDLFGKRSLIFNKRGDWCKKNVSKELLKDIVEEVLQNAGEKKERICELLNLYGLDHHSKEFGDRFDKYEEIVMSEW